MATRASAAVLSVAAGAATSVGAMVAHRRREPPGTQLGAEAACETSIVGHHFQATIEPLGSLSGSRGLDMLTLRSVAQCRSAEFKSPRIGTSDRVRRDCGEDAYFLAAPTATTATVGIADGVGGWASQGIDPALFAWELMNRCQDAAEERGRARTPACFKAPSDPKRLIECGYEMLKTADGGAPVGSCTACVASLDRRSGELRVANLGDSGAILVRGSSGECLLQSRAQQHGFNCPYQLMVAPEDYTGGDMPEQADEYVAKVEVGDLLILATDGLLDNISTEQAVAVAANMHAAEPEAIANCLVSLARRRSIGTEVTPFSIAARAAGIRHVGGKPDDITVIVARVEREAQVE